MSKVEKSVTWAISIANDNSHGYDQVNRWGKDYDCSSLVISAWEQAGVKVKTKGATYTGNMKKVFLECGFKDVTADVNLGTGKGIKRGDVLLNEIHHTAMSIGNNMIVHASCNEYGKAVGGKTGDQTKKEICTRSYYNYPWNCVLRFEESTDVKPKKTLPPVANPILRKGCTGTQVKYLQQDLNYLGIKDKSNKALTVDGDFGKCTKEALEKFQKVYKIEVDGIYGAVSRGKMGSAIK